MRMRRLTILLLGSMVVLVVEAQPADWSTLFVRAMRLQEAGQHAQAIPLAEQALTLAQAHYGPKNRSVGLALNLLGQLYTAEGKYDEAEAFLKRALDIYHKWFGAQSPESAGVLNNLGRLYLDRGQPEQAVLVLQEALARFEQAYGSGAIAYATRWNCSPRPIRPWIVRMKPDAMPCGPPSFHLRHKRSSDSRKAFHRDGRAAPGTVADGSQAQRTIVPA